VRYSLHIGGGNERGEPVWLLVSRAAREMNEKYQGVFTNACIAAKTPQRNLRFMRIA
jgi:hypothetical protein